MGDHMDAGLCELLEAWDGDPELAEELARAAAASRERPESPVSPEHLSVVPETDALVQRSAAHRVLSPQFPKSKPKYKSTWARQQHEMRELRRKIEELTAVLQQLQMPSAAMLTLGDGDWYDDKRGVQSGFKWRQRAAREREELMHARHDNTRLRLGVLEGERAVKRLRRIVLNRAAQQARVAELVDLKTSAHLCREFAPTLDDATMFRKAIAGLADMHRSVESALRLVDQGLASSPNSYRKWTVQFDASASVELEMIECHEVPFAMREVEDAMAALQLKNKASRQMHKPQDFGASQDVLVQTSSNPLQVEDGFGSRRAHQATHLLSGDARSVSVSVVYVAISEQSRHPTPDLVLRIKTWIILTPIAHVDVATGQVSHATAIRTLSKATPVLLRRAWPVRWERSSIERIVVPTWDRAMTTNQQRLENALIDRRMSTRHHL